MPGKAPEIVGRVVRAEIIEHEERIEQRHLAEPKRPPQVHACVFDRGFALQDLL